MEIFFFEDRPDLIEQVTRALGDLDQTTILTTKADCLREGSSDYQLVSMKVATSHLVIINCEDITPMDYWCIGICLGAGISVIGLDNCGWRPELYFPPLLDAITIIPMQELSGVIQKLLDGLSDLGMDGYLEACLEIHTKFLESRKN